MEASNVMKLVFILISATSS